METRRLQIALSVLALAPLAACGPDLTGPDAVDRVEVRPASATLRAVGRTEDFTARALSASGERVREVSFRWSTADAGVATVDSTGTATAAGGGTTRIQVRVRDTEITGSAELTVDQEVASITVTPDSSGIAALEATRQFRAEATDPNGNAVSGEPVDWSSTRAAVATVDSSGLAVARAEGETGIVAAAEDVADTARLIVDQRVNSVTVRPDSVVASEGDTVRLEAEATDATDHVVSDASFSWSSTDSGIVSVASTTDTTADVAGVGEGVARVVAEAPSGIGDTARFTVGVNVAARSLFLRPRGVLEDSTVELGAVVANTGTGDIQSLDWSVRRGDGTELRSGTISLSEGSADSLPTQSGLGPFPAGTHRLVLVVDPDDEVDEFRETDNRETARLESYRPGYEIELQFVGEVSDSLRSVTRSARDRWGRAVTSDLPAVAPEDSIDLGRCIEDAGKRGEPIDDLLVLVRSDSIDGEGGVLARAGPCFVRDSDTDPRVPPIPVVGGMVVDTADADGSGDALAEIVLHEVGHVLGFGTLWDFQGGDGEGPYRLLEGAGTDDPVFKGPFAIERFLAIGGDDYDGEPVPVANQGGQGTRDSHWRESVFANELMTGFLDPSLENPLSVVTLASLADQFYSVDFSEADPFQITVSGAVAARPAAGGIELGDHLLRVPLFGVTPSGRVRRLGPVQRR